MLDYPSFVPKKAVAKEAYKKHIFLINNVTKSSVETEMKDAAKDYERRF